MVESIGADLHRLELGFRAPLGATAYLHDAEELTLVDAGLPINATPIRTEIAAAGYDVSDVDRVLLTHYDLDHLGGLARLVPDLDAPVYIGRADLALLRGDRDPPLTHPKGLFHRGLRLVHSPPSSLSYEPVDDGDEIGEFRAFHTPGHNPGHTVYVHRESATAFLGDLVWGEDGALTTPIWLDSYDLDELGASLEAFVRTGPAFDRACVGHGPPVRTDGDSVLRALADRIGG